MVRWLGTAHDAYERHCAVDPKKIPYGSKIFFHDAECMAVDSGPAVVNRKAARFAWTEQLLSATLLSLIAFSIRNKMPLLGQKRILIFVTVRIDTSEPSF